MPDLITFPSPRRVLSKLALVLFIAYLTIAQYHNFRTEVRYWLGYEESCK